jgi:hypothetical protein
MPRRLPPPWKSSDPPKDREFLAFALPEGSRDAPGSVKPVRIVAAWNALVEAWRPVRTPDEAGLGLALKIFCWCDLPAEPPD